MVAKIISATDVRVGTNMIENELFYTVKKIDISKTGKHGHAKARIEAANMFTGNKKIFLIPGHDKVEIPSVNKNKAQILSILSDNKLSIMDAETFETIEIEVPEELQGQFAENDTLEYWSIEGNLLLKRKL